MSPLAIHDNKSTLYSVPDGANLSKENFDKLKELAVLYNTTDNYDFNRHSDPESIISTDISHESEPEKAPKVFEEAVYDQYEYFFDTNNDALYQSIKSKLIALFKPYAFAIQLQTPSGDDSNKNIRHYSITNPDPDWFHHHLNNLQRSLSLYQDFYYNTNLSDESLAASILLHNLSCYDYLKKLDAYLTKVLSPSLTPQALKDQIVAKAILDNWTSLFNHTIFLSSANHYEIVTSNETSIEILSEKESRQFIQNVDLSNHIIIDAKKGTLI